MPRVFLLGCGPLPFESSRLHSGPGIRTWQLAKPLLETGHELRLVALCPPGESLQIQAGLPGLDLIKIAEPALLLDLVREFAPDVLVGATAYPSFLLARLGLDQPLWADLFGDPMAEAQARASTDADDWAVANNRYMLYPILERADGFSVVSERHKDVLLGQLGVAGRLNRHNAGVDLIHVIPCAWSQELAPLRHTQRKETIERETIVALSSGGFNTWCDIGTLQRALELAMDQEPRLRFVATGGPIPGFDDHTFKQFRVLVARSAHAARFELTGWIEREELARRELEADFGIVAEKPLLERRLGSANRCLHWMGRGVPFVCARISELSEQLEREGLALTYPPGDERALAAAILRLAREPELRRQLAARAERVARESFSFVTTTAGLREWLQQPRSAPDRGLFQLWPDRTRETQLETEIGGLHEHLQAIHSSRMWKLWMASIAIRRWPRRGASALGRAASAVEHALVLGLSVLGRGLRVVGEAVSARLAKLWELVRTAAVWCYLVLFTIGRSLRWVVSHLRPAMHKAMLPTPVVAAAPSGRRPRILVVCPYPVFPAYQGSSTRISHLFKRLAARWDVYLFVFSHTSDDPYQRGKLAGWCKQLVIHRREDAGPARPWDVEPRTAQYFASQTVRERLIDFVCREEIDVVQLEHTELGQYVDALGRARVVLCEHDLGFITSLRRRAAGFHRRFDVDRQLWSSRGDWMRLFRYELRVCEKMDQIQVMSERDGATLNRFIAGGRQRIRVVPNGVAVSPEPPSVEVRNRRVLFLGYFGHSPNLDAVHYLVEEIWPLVRARRPDAELTIAGATPPASVTALDGRDGVEVVGTVPDPGPYYRGHRLLAAPLRAGSGTRLKILEAFADGLPVVTTPLGAEGLAVRSGEHLLLAEGPAEHAEAILQLLEDDALHGRLAAAARALVVARYSWESVADIALVTYTELLARSRTVPHGSPELAPALAPGAAPLAPPAEVDVSVIIPTLNGGARLEQCLGALAAQITERRFEVICVDSGSRESDLEVFRRFGVRLVRIWKAAFNHGLTRDLGARQARGRVLVFLNQDAVPCDRYWLDALTDPLLRPGPYAAIQGGIREFPDSGARFYWHSCGNRFYFTRETARWLEEYRGLGFSTVNAAIRREAWERIPFGWAPIMEDKKWQRQARRAGLEIAQCPYAAVFHSHTYDGRTLVKRCAAEGFGWRTLGIAYSLRDLIADWRAKGMVREALRGLRRREIRSTAELFFPFLRPLSLYWGNRWLRSLPS